MVAWRRARRAGTPISGRLYLHAVILCLALLALAGGLTGVSQGQSDHAVLVDIDDAINPITAGYLDRALEEAREDGAKLFIVQLDTPGGLLESTRDMVSDLLDSKVPTVVYVAPSGARAASAGTFITAAAHFAVMAPATNIGAASPVGSGRRGSAGDHQEQGHGGCRRSDEGHRHRARAERREAGGDSAEGCGLHL